MPVFRIERAEKRKVVPGFRGRYAVSDLGKVYSGDMEMSLIGGRYVNLCMDGGVERRDVAYLVARAFLPNLEGRPFVIHRDGDRRNNRVENLEWSEKKEERKARGSAVDARRVVLQYDRDGVLVQKYRSIWEASEKTGVARSLIRNCAEGKARRAKEWIFRYGN